MKADWESQRLAKVATKITDGSHNPPKGDVFSDFLMLSSKNVFDDCLHYAEPRYLTAEQHQQEDKRTGIVPGDVLLTIVGTIGRSAVVPTEAPKISLQRSVAVIRPNKEIVEPRFMMYSFIERCEELNRQARGVAQKGIYLETLRELEFKFPSLPEQHRIVSLLDEAFANIATTKTKAEMNLQNARELFETYLRNLLNSRTTDGIKTTLQKCCDQIFAGGDVPKDRVSNERTATYPVPIFSNGTKDDGLYGFTDTARVTKPSVTVSARGTLGFSAIRNEPFLPVVRLIVLTPNENLIDLSFLHYTVLGMDFENTGTSIPQLTVPNFKDLSIYLPPVAKQKELVFALDSMRDEIQNLESIYRQKLTALDTLKKSLLHQAFSGQL